LDEKKKKGIKKSRRPPKKWEDKKLGGGGAERGGRNVEKLESPTKSKSNMFRPETEGVGKADRIGGGALFC